MSLNKLKTFAIAAIAALTVTFGMVTSASAWGQNYPTIQGEVRVTLDDHLTNIVEATNNYQGRVYWRVWYAEPNADPRDLHEPFPDRLFNPYVIAHDLPAGSRLGIRTVEGNQYVFYFITVDRAGHYTLGRDDELFRRSR